MSKFSAGRQKGTKEPLSAGESGENKEGNGVQETKGCEEKFF